MNRSLYIPSPLYISTLFLSPTRSISQLTTFNILWTMSKMSQPTWYTILTGLISMHSGILTEHPLSCTVNQIRWGNLLLEIPLMSQNRRSARSFLFRRLCQCMNTHQFKIYKVSSIITGYFFQKMIWRDTEVDSQILFCFYNFFFQINL